MRRFIGEGWTVVQHSAWHSARRHCATWNHASSVFPPSPSTVFRGRRWLTLLQPEQRNVAVVACASVFAGALGGVFVGSTLHNGVHDSNTADDDDLHRLVCPKLPDPPKHYPARQRSPQLFGDYGRVDEFEWVRDMNMTALDAYLEREWHYAEEALAARAKDLRGTILAELTNRCRLLAPCTTQVSGATIAGASTNPADENQGDTYIFGAEFPSQPLPVVVQCTRGGWAQHQKRRQNESNADDRIHACKHCVVLFDPNSVVGGNNIATASHATSPNIRSSPFDESGLSSTTNTRPHYFRVPSIRVSRDGRLAAFALDTVGRERFDLYVVRLDGGGDNGDAASSDPRRTPTLVASNCGDTFAWVHCSGGGGDVSEYALLFPTLGADTSACQAVHCARIRVGTANNIQQVTDAASATSTASGVRVKINELCVAANTEALFNVWESDTGRIVFVSEATHSGNSLRFVETDVHPRMRRARNGGAARARKDIDTGRSRSRSSAAGAGDDRDDGADFEVQLHFVRAPHPDEFVDAQDWGEDFFILHVGQRAGHSSIRWCRQSAAIAAAAAAAASASMTATSQSTRPAADSDTGKTASAVTIAGLDGWERVWDESHQSHYFHHRATGTSVWDLPSNTDLARLACAKDNADYSSLINRHGSDREEKVGEEVTLLEFHDHGEDLATLPFVDSRAICADRVFVTKTHLFYLQRTNKGLTEFAWHRIEEVEEQLAAETSGRRRKKPINTHQRITPKPRLRLRLGPRNVVSSRQLLEAVGGYTDASLCLPYQAGHTQNTTWQTIVGGPRTQSSAHVVVLEENSSPPLQLSVEMVAQPTSRSDYVAGNAHSVPTTTNASDESVVLRFSNFAAPASAVRVCLQSGALAVVRSGHNAARGNVTDGGGGDGEDNEDDNAQRYCQFRLWIRAPRNVPSQQQQEIQQQQHHDRHVTNESSCSDTNGHNCRHHHRDFVYVPITVAYKRGCASLDGSSPALVRVYGSYGTAADPLSFCWSDLSLLDRGIVLVHAHVRGGGELGSYWHEEGRGLLKRNAVSDLHACLEALQGRAAGTGFGTGFGTDDDDHALVAIGRVALHGFSAGGLVAAALANVAPNLVRVLLLDSPFVDPLTSMLDPTLPLVVAERGEWCDPLSCQECYFYLQSYSPYDNIPPEIEIWGGTDNYSATSSVASTSSCGGGGGFCGGGAESGRLVFPDTLVTGGVQDARVMFWEPFKYVNRLRNVLLHGNCLKLGGDSRSKTPPPPPQVYLRMFSAAAGGGHTQNDNRAGRINHEAFMHAFVLARLSQPPLPSPLHWQIQYDYLFQLCSTASHGTSAYRL